MDRREVSSAGLRGAGAPGVDLRGAGAPGVDKDVLDRDIEQALAVDPSPEFLARVRQRIANEPAPSQWRLSRFTWGFAVAGAMTVVVMAVMVSRTAPSKPTPIGKPVLAARTLSGAGTLSAGAGAELAPPTAGAQAFRPAKKEMAQALRPAVAEPEILLDPREGAALRALLTGVREGRIDADTLRRARAAAPSAELRDLVVEPIVIADLPFAPSAEGVRQ